MLFGLLNLQAALLCPCSGRVLVSRSSSVQAQPDTVLVLDRIKKHRISSPSILDIGLVRYQRCNTSLREATYPSLHRGVDLGQSSLPNAIRILGNRSILLQSSRSNRILSHGIRLQCFGELIRLLGVFERDCSIGTCSRKSVGKGLVVLSRLVDDGRLRQVGTLSS